jgi:uncharacterized protein (TIGR00369 family)
MTTKIRRVREIRAKGLAMRKLNPKYVEAISALVNRSPYFSLLSMSIRKIELGYALLDIDVQNKHLQPFQAVHGGVFASIIDAAAFWAVYGEIEDNVGMTSVDLKVNYLAPAREGRLIARGRRIKIGKTLALGEAEVTNEKNRMVAHGTSTLMILGEVGGTLHGLLPPKFIDQREPQ